MRHLAIVGLTAACCIAGLSCGSSQPARTEDGTMTTERPISDEVRGVAENAKGGAVIVAETGRIVYIVGLDSWPDEFLNQTVVAHGTLERTDYIPDPVVADDGAISAGAEGLDWVLRDARWSIEPR